MNFKKSLLLNFFLLFLSLLILLIALAFVDRLYGKYFAAHTKEFIYPPCSKAHHKSSEFDITVIINSLGFRDYEYSLAKKKKKRIVVIGDSFTFGWGVDLEDCWVKLLEKELNNEGINVEILNIGKGGASPADYAQTAEKIIPILKPDLVVVAVLQANDLHQLIHAYDKLPIPKLEQEEKIFFAEKIHSILHHAFPNFMKIISVKNIDISSQWKREAPALLHSFPEEQKQCFEKLNEKVKADFQSGSLNPWLIHQAVYYPDYFTQTLDTTDLDVVIGISAMADYFEKIQQVSSANNAELFILSVPNLPYSSKEERNSLKKYGFEIPDSLFGNSLADEIIKMAANENEIGFYSVSEKFINSKKQSNLYYPFDGHFTKEGNLLFANSARDLFVEKIKGL